MWDFWWLLKTRTVLSYIQRILNIGSGCIQLEDFHDLRFKQNKNLQQGQFSLITHFGFLSMCYFFHYPSQVQFTSSTKRTWRRPFILSDIHQSRNTVLSHAIFVRFQAIYHPNREHDMFKMLGDGTKSVGLLCCWF